MAIRRRSIGREVGTAFAVLALYLLTILLPLHQAAGLQRDLDKLGFATLESWSICVPLAQDENGNPTAPTVSKCPAAGIAKRDFAALVPAHVPVVGPTTATALRWTVPSPRTARAIPQHFGQSRAPPVTV